MTCTCQPAARCQPGKQCLVPTVQQEQQPQVGLQQLPGLGVLQLLLVLLLLAAGGSCLHLLALLAA